MLRKLILIFSVVSIPAHAVGPDPRQDWRTADSPHFRINYLAQHRAQAERAAAIGESAYARLVTQFRWEPDGKTEIALIDAFDISNGYSTPLPFNNIALFLTPPDEGELLENSDWLDLLVTHELTHTVHLDKARGIPEMLRHIAGRNPLLFPNLIQPGWGIEGIATFNESTPELGRGRLRSPHFEALMRVERERGFLSLTKINANGRALPTSKQYLYGVYFYDFLIRQYGADAAYRYIHNYSGNILPRVSSNPELLTGKPMEELWEEFLSDLTRQVDTRATAIKATPRADGTPLLPAQFRVYSLAQANNGVYAASNDGLNQTQLQHIAATGETRQLALLQEGARLASRADGSLLIAQPDICDDYNFFYDLYLWNEKDGLTRLSHCQRYRRAVWLGEHIAALKYEGGIASVELLRLQGSSLSKVSTLYAEASGINVIDLAASLDGQRLALIQKRAGAWQVLEFDVASGTSRLLFDYAAPLFELRYARDGKALYFIASQGGVNNLWRFDPASKTMARLSHSYTGVTHHSGVAADGTITLGVLAAGGIELRRLASPAEQSSLPATAGSPLLATAAPASTLGDATEYSALNSLRPRTWFPAMFVDRGLSAVGVSTFGMDALGWHNYSVTAMWENTRGELLGGLNYAYLDRHFFSLTRNLWTRQWMGNPGEEIATIVDRTTDLQWVSVFPWEHTERRVYAGLGAAQQSTEREYLGGYITYPQMERVAAAFLQYDSKNSNWFTTENNRGSFANVLFETYAPFAGDYDGHLLRLDVQKLWPLGDKVISARWTEVRTNGSTEIFQLGGAFDYASTWALNQRYLPLRGYAGDELQLQGQDTRTMSLEFSAPLADIDRHLMSPPVGINRLSTNVFLDAGSVWNQGDSPTRLYRGVGVELRAEVKLAYQLMLPFTVGIARGLDLDSGNRLYLQLGSSF